jgi:prepilin-type N-terminal cleavage/methylation domain-containing protein
MGERGVSVIEMMAAVAVVGVLATIATGAVKRRGHGASAYEFAQKLEGELDDLRLRAVTKRRWQQLIIQNGYAEHDEATTTGMATPTAWQTVRTVMAPQGVEVAAVDNLTHTASGSTPTLGSGMGTIVQVAPDGTGAAVTIFVRETNDSSRARVTAYPAGGLYVFTNW